MIDNRLLKKAENVNEKNKLQGWRGYKLDKNETFYI